LKFQVVKNTFFVADSEEEDDDEDEEDKEEEEGDEEEEEDEDTEMGSDAGSLWEGMEGLEFATDDEEGDSMFFQIHYFEITNKCNSFNRGIAG